MRSPSARASATNAGDPHGIPEHQIQLGPVLPAAGIWRENQWTSVPSFFLLLLLTIK